MRKSNPDDASGEWHVITVEEATRRIERFDRWLLALYVLLGLLAVALIIGLAGMLGAYAADGYGPLIPPASTPFPSGFTP